MILKELYKYLVLEGHNSSSIYIAKPIESELGLKLAIDNLHSPVLLIPEDKFQDSNLSKSNYRLNYLEILFNQNCLVRELEQDVNKSVTRFTTIRLIDGSTRMIDYFLSLLEVLIGKIISKPNFILLNEEIKILVDLFSVQKPIDSKVVLGLWGELFYIKQSKSIAESVKAWHADETNIFDFTFLNNKSIEVKTTTQSHRIHEFSQKQIEKYKSFDVEIASIITESSSFGVSLKELWDEIDMELEEVELKSKLTMLISTTLKSDFQALYDYRYNLEFANSSIKHINTMLIPTITEELHPSIRNVRLSIELDSI